MEEPLYVPGHHGWSQARYHRTHRNCSPWTCNGRELHRLEKLCAVSAGIPGPLFQEDRAVRNNRNRRHSRTIDILEIPGPTGSD